MLIQKYYLNPENYVYIQQYLKDRETVFKNSEGKIIRNIKCNQPLYLKRNADHYDLYKNEYNIYHSIATYSNMPLFSWDMNKRKKQYDDWTHNENHVNYITDYDFYMDFDDKGDFDLTFEEIKAVSNYLTKKNIKHMIYFSGSGFHLKSKLPIGKKTPEYARKICERFIEMFLLSTVDLSIYRWQGIIKTPYSIDFKTGRMCTPINPVNLKDFKVEFAELKK